MNEPTLHQIIVFLIGYQQHIYIKLCLEFYTNNVYFLCNKLVFNTKNKFNQMIIYAFIKLCLIVYNFIVNFDYELDFINIDLYVLTPSLKFNI